MLSMLATLLATFWLLAALAVSVSAGLYGTSPVASTVWNAGRSYTVTWTDDKSAPHLAQFGRVDIELLSGGDDESPIATLARDVDAATRAQAVWVSPAWGHNGSDYYLCFRSKTLRTAVYTASFTILDMASLAPAAAAAADNQTTTARALYTPYLTLVLPNTTLVSALAPQPRTSALSPTATPVSADDESAYRRAHEPHGASSSSGAAGGRHAVVDFERLKFRLVFILWPAVVGLTMAM